MSNLSLDAKIIIIGAGVFGLSTALHLARAGYHNITIFDRCNFNSTHYNPDDGCDGASADINKIFRSAYGSKAMYQTLALEALEEWLAWNKAIAQSSTQSLPTNITPEDKVLDRCGVYFLGAGKVMREHYKDSLDNLKRTAPEVFKQQFLKNSADAERKLKQLDDKTGSKWIQKYHAIDKLMDGNTHGFLDLSGGLMLADKACTYAKYLCEKAGVKFVLGEPHGKLYQLVVEEAGNEKKVTGITTCDGTTHSADLVVLACGAWTSSILPQAHRTVEATTGSLFFIDIPKHRNDLWEKFHPDNFPVWHFKRGNLGEPNFYEGGGFPITKEGRIKIGFRGRKLTNFEDHPTETGLKVSMPWTKYSAQPCNTVPLYNLEAVKEVVWQLFPELEEFSFTDTRLCWYTDSIDNDFVIDYVPGYSDSLFICTGGSGHGFKFLPVLGKYVRHQIERNEDQFTDLWKWRTAEEGRSANGLELGEARDIKNFRLAKPEDFKVSSDVVESCETVNSQRRELCSS